MGQEPESQVISQTQPSKRRLLDQVRIAIRSRHYSRRTEESYLHWIRRYIYFTGKRHPIGLGAAEVTAFLNDLVANRNVAGTNRVSVTFLWRVR